MNKKVLAIVSAVILTITVSTAYLLISSDEVKAPVASTEEQSSTDNEQSVVPATPGQYINYYDGIIAQTPENKLLFFHAPWCPQCRDLEADINKNGVPTGQAIIKVDYDSNQALRQKYGVKLQTTIVLINDRGEEVSKFVAYDTPTLKAVQDNIFSR